MPEKGQRWTKKVKKGQKKGKQGQEKRKVGGGLALGVGAFLHFSAVEMSIVGLTIGAVLAMELLNTAIESVVDLTVKQNYHELARIAKDCAAAAVLISALAAIGVASSLILPRLFIKLWQIFQISSFLQ